MMTNDRIEAALKDVRAFVAVLLGRGPDAVIPETITTPLGVQVKIGSIMRDVDAAIDACRAATEAKTASVGVKPLEWTTYADSGTYRAKKPFGSSYFIEQRDDLKYDWNGQLFDELADAKAAAQADYEARIRSALTFPASPWYTGQDRRDHAHGGRCHRQGRRHPAQAGHINSRD